MAPKLEIHGLLAKTPDRENRASFDRVGDQSHFVATTINGVGSGLIQTARNDVYKAEMK